MGAMELEHTLSRVSTADVVHVHAKTYIVLASIFFAYFAQLVGVVGSGLLAQSIQRLFGGTNESVWLAQVINIFTAVLSPPVSQIADLWGRKWPLVVAMVCGGVGSIVAARAQSMGAVIAGFCVIGVSFGGQPLLHAVVSEVLPRRQRPLAQAGVNATAGTGAFIGICMGGALLRHNQLDHYRVYLYVTAGVFFAAALGIGLCYNPPIRPLQGSLTAADKLRRLDWVGYALFTPGLVLFCVALSWSRNPYPWSDPRVAATFAVGVAFTVAFFVYEWRVKADGVLNHGLFRRRNFALALLAIFAEGLTFFTANNYFPFEVSIFTGQDLLIAGLHFGVTFLTSVVFALLSGFYSTRRKALRWPTAFGFLLILVFNIAMAATSAEDPGAAFWGFAVILGAGIGIILPAIMVVAQLSTPPDLISTASALVIATRAVGGTVGLAINNAIFNSALATEIPRRITAAAVPLGLPPTSLGALIGALTAQDQAALGQVPGVTSRIIGAAADALVRAYGVGFRDCWIAACCFCFVALIASLFFYDPKEEFNAHIDAPAEEKVAEKQGRIEGAVRTSVTEEKSADGEA